MNFLDQFEQSELLLVKVRYSHKIVVISSSGFGKTFMDETNIKYINKIRPFFRRPLSLAKENKNTNQTRNKL